MNIKWIRCLALGLIVLGTATVRTAGSLPARAEVSSTLYQPTLDATADPSSISVSGSHFSAGGTVQIYYEPTTPNITIDGKPAQVVFRVLTATTDSGTFSDALTGISWCATFNVYAYDESTAQYSNVPTVTTANCPLTVPTATPATRW